MEMKHVDSSNIQAIGYDAESSTLQVEFKNGGTYQYFDVPERIFNELEHAASVGGYLASAIKGTYRYSKV
ncbi:MAG: KTSC domain-containing protein [Pseudomonadota bacterium]